MSNNGGFVAVSRRDAIRLIAATPASGAVFATSLAGAASASIMTSAPGAAGQFAQGSAAAQGAAATGLADLAAAHFEPLVGQTFSIGGDRATLTEVRRGPASGTRFREQFALTFSAPPHAMRSDVIPVSHPAIGRHDLHVAQVGVADLEICFS